MKIGMNLLLWTTDATTEEMLPVLARLKGMGFDGVEVPVFDLQPRKFELLGRRLDEIGLERTAVTVASAADNPSSSDASIRHAALERSKLALQCCQALGSTKLVGPLYAALGVFSGTGPTQDEWRWSVETLQKVSQNAEECKVTLGIEFLNRFEIYLINCAADAVRYVRDVDHPRCKMMFDTFHAHIEEKNMTTALLGCAEHLCHVHISESDRSTPGSGQLHWRETWAALKKIRYDGWLTIEAFGQSLEALISATKIWRRMYHDEDTLARDGLAFIKRSWSQTESSVPAHAGQVQQKRF